MSEILFNHNKNLMRTLVFTFLIFSYLQPFAQITAPDLSPLATVKQEIGLTEVTIAYSRPSRRGRVIFGSAEDALIPNDNYWRTGANGVTKFVFSDSISVANNRLPAGSYTVLSKPGAEKWQMNWYAYDSNSWTDYLAQEPLFVIEIKVNKTEQLVETLEIAMRDIGLNSANLVFQWERTQISIPLQLNENWKVMKSIKQTLAGPSNSDYFRAALYLHESKRDLNKALEYIQKVTSSKDARFFQVSREAQILADLGKTSKAIESAKRGLALSKEADNQDFIRLNTKILKELGEG